MNRPRVKNLDQNLPPCVYFKNGGYFYVKRGKWHPLGRNRAKAMAAYGLLYEGEPGSMPELIAKAMEEITRSVKPNTAAQYRVAGRRLSKKLADFRPAEVTHSTVAGIRKDLAGTPNMANRCITVLRMVFHYATENEIVATNPVIGAKRFTEKKRKRLLTPEEVEAIRAASGERLQLIIDLAIRTGQRIGDVLKIHRADLLPSGIRFEQKKTGAKLIIKWTDELREAASRAKALNQNIRALTLLANRRGKAPDYSTIKIQWDKARKAAGVPDANLHDLRAYAATHAKRQGLPPTPLLGHTTPAQTERYLRDRDALLVEGPSFGQSKNLLDIAQKNAGK